MTWWERRGFNTFYVVVAATGFIYFYMKYVLVTDDPFAIINHPWQPAMLSFHLVAAALFVAFFGMLFRSHSFGKIRSAQRENRRTGWTSLLSFAAMALSGYFIQVASSPALITAWIWIHVAASTLFVAGYGVHLVNGWRIGRRPAAGATASPPSLPGPVRLAP